MCFLLSSSTMYHELMFASTSLSPIYDASLLLFVPPKLAPTKVFLISVYTQIHSPSNSKYILTIIPTSILQYPLFRIYNFEEPKKTLNVVFQSVILIFHRIATVNAIKTCILYSTRFKKSFSFSIPILYTWFVCTPVITFPMVQKLFQNPLISPLAFIILNKTFFLFKLYNYPMSCCKPTCINTSC